MWDGRLKERMGFTGMLLSSTAFDLELFWWFLSGTPILLRLGNWLGVICVIVAGISFLSEGDIVIALGGSFIALLGLFYPNAHYFRLWRTSSGDILHHLPELEILDIIIVYGISGIIVGFFAFFFLAIIYYWLTNAKLH